MKILVAGVGNLLRGDDGFGVRVIEALFRVGVPDGVDLYEAGIGGIPLVQELMKGYDALIAVDAVDKGQGPGTLFVLAPVAEQTSVAELHQQMIDAHYADPAKVLLLARALNVCPPSVFIVGCQPAQVEDAVETLHPAVAQAVPLAVAQVLSLIESLLQQSR
jgi:hydrogenase maturation protease